MLLWRIIFGAVFIAVLVLLVWLDSFSSRPGLALLPLACVLSIVATHEVVALIHPHVAASTRGCWQGASLLAVLLSGAPLLWSCQDPSRSVGSLGWLAVGVTAGLAVVVWRELRSYEPGSETIDRFARGALAVVYISGGIGWMVQLRLGPLDTTPTAKWGILSLISLVAIVKAGPIAGGPVLEPGNHLLPLHPGRNVPSPRRLCRSHRRLANPNQPYIHIVYS